MGCRRRASGGTWPAQPPQLPARPRANKGLLDWSTVLRSPPSCKALGCRLAPAPSRAAGCPGALPRARSAGGLAQGPLPHSGDALGVPRQREERSWESQGLRPATLAPLPAVLSLVLLGPTHPPNISQTPPQEAWRRTELCPHRMLLGRKYNLAQHAVGAGPATSCVPAPAPSVSEHLSSTISPPSRNRCLRGDGLRVGSSLSKYTFLSLSMLTALRPWSPRPPGQRPLAQGAS